MIRKNVIKRSLYWPINALLFYLLKFNVFRDKKLWVYGCWEGSRYDDNSRYLFEYVSRNHPEIHSVWLSSHESVVDLVRKQGFEAYRSDSLKGLQIQLRAGVCFFTNGLDDISNIQLVHGAKIIGLWHGTGMKNVYYERLAQTGSKFSFYLKRLRDKIFSVTYQDYAIATSKAAAKMRMQTYLLKPKQLLITGQPRNDVFRLKLLPHQVFPSLADADSYTYLLYMPTYRPYKTDVIESLLKELSQNEQLISELNKNHVRFLLKLHYLTDIDVLQLQSPFIVLKSKDVSSVQELLAVSECMITDFSGCCIDFALRNKPVLLYTPDLDLYCETQSIKKEWISIYHDYAKLTADALATEIIEIINNRKTDFPLIRIINKIYASPDLTDACYSENVYQAVSDLL